MQAVVRADHYRCLRKCLQHRPQGVGGQLAVLIVIAEGNHSSRLGARRAKQVEPDPVAIIDLGAELAGKLDLARFLVDQGDADALGHHHLCYGLAEAAVADDNGAGFRRQLGSVEIIAPNFAPLEKIDEAHQERRARHRQRHDCTEQGRGFGRDQPRGGSLCEQDEAKLAGLAQQEAEADTARPCGPEAAADQADDDGLGGDDGGRDADNEQGTLGDNPEVEQHPHREEEKP